ncbi:MAG: roadblock/LC7 domain-containing protein, partial [Solirubrobacteraceae bacterium]|nr:roadblock/LC7 domain-containing protein [Solirubrobacteraceae bacterium]
AAHALLADLDGAAAVVVATPDGFEIAHAGARLVDAPRLAAIVSSLAALGDTVSHETRIGALRCLVVESSEGRLVVRSVQVRGEAAVVVMLADAKVLLGLIWNRLAMAEKLLDTP